MRCRTSAPPNRPSDRNRSACPGPSPGGPCPPHGHGPTHHRTPGAWGLPGILRGHAGEGCPCPRLQPPRGTGTRPSGRAPCRPPATSKGQTKVTSIPCSFPDCDITSSACPAVRAGRWACTMGTAHPWHLPRTNKFNKCATSPPSPRPCGRGTRDWGSSAGAAVVIGPGRRGRARRSIPRTMTWCRTPGASRGAAGHGGTRAQVAVFGNGPEHA